MTLGNPSPGHLKIAFVITELEVGGAEQCLANLATRLDPERFQPTVFSLAARPAAGQDALVRQLEAARVPLQFIGARTVWDAWSAVRALRRHLVELQPHVVQSFLFHANVLGTLAARQAGVAHVAMGVRVADPSMWRQRVERWCARRADRVVCVSQSVADTISWVRDLPAEKQVVIPNGIDTTRFLAVPPVDRSSLGIPGDRRVAVAVGRLHKQKGLDWLLTSASQLLEQVPDLELLIVGSGPEQASLAAVAERLSVSSRIRFLGWRSDVPGIMKSCDLFLLPSRWEGMPNALLEAMASGLPVVATRAEGVRELLGDGYKTQTVEFGDTKALIASVAELVKNPALCREWGAQNRQRVQAKYSLDQMVQSYRQLFEELARS